MTDTFFEKFSPASEELDMVIYERIYKKNEDDYQDIEDFNPFAAMGGFLRKNVMRKSVPLTSIAN